MLAVPLCANAADLSRLAIGTAVAVMPDEPGVNRAVMTTIGATGSVHADAVEGGTPCASKWDGLMSARQYRCDSVLSNRVPLLAKPDMLMRWNINHFGGTVGLATKADPAGRRGDTTRRQY
jgi:hypothetical protein